MKNTNIITTKILIGSVITFACAGVLIAPAQSEAKDYGDVSTYVSKPYYGDGKKAVNALFDFPEDFAIASDGSIIIADTYNHAIRKVNASTDKAETVAGTGSYGHKNGSTDTAEFAFPAGVDIDSNGTIYVADTGNGKIKRISGGSVKTLVKNLDNPVAVAAYGSTLYFLDSEANTLQRVSTGGGSATTITSSLSSPQKLAITSDGQFAYVSNDGTNTIVRVHLSSGTVVTVAGDGSSGSSDGSASTAEFDRIRGLHLVDDNTILVADGTSIAGSVRTISFLNSGGITGTINDSARAQQIFVNTTVYDATDNVLISVGDVALIDGELTVLSTGTGSIVSYDHNTTTDNNGASYLLTVEESNELVAGKNRFNVRRKSPMMVGQPKYFQESPNGKYVYFSENNRIRRFKKGVKKKYRKAKLIAGSVIDNYAASDSKTYYKGDARFSDIPSFAIAPKGKKLYVVDRNNNRIREVVVADGGVSYLTGAGAINADGDTDNGYADGVACPNEFDTGVSGCAYFNRPTGSALSKKGKYLFVADSGNNVIRRVTVKGSNKGKVKTIAGSGVAGYTNAKGTSAQFDAPFGLALSKNGKALFVADRNNHVIRKIRLKDKKVTTLAGTGDNGYVDGSLDKAQFSLPEWLAVDKEDGNIYVSEVSGNTIRYIDKKTGVTKLVAGSGDRGYTNGSQKEAEFDNPRGMLILKKKLLVAELRNDTIRSIWIEGDAPFTEAAPVVSSVVPNRIAKEWFSGSTASVEVVGENFRHGAIGYVGGHQAVNTYVRSETSIVIEVPITQMSAGYYEVKIMNSDTQADSAFRALAVSDNGYLPETDYYNN